MHSGQIATWASAWQPGPVGKVARGRLRGARDDAVVRSPASRWRLDDGKVQPGSTRRRH
jgi:hypothetical protein